MSSSNASAAESIPSSPVPKTLSSQTTEKGGTHGLEFIFWLLQRSKLFLALIPVAAATIVTAVAMLITGSDWNWLLFAISAVAAPLVGVGIPVAILVRASWREENTAADWTPYLRFTDAKESQKWEGKKIPMTLLYEAYMAGRIEFIADVYETMLHRNQLFRMSFTWHDIRFYIAEFLRQNTGHDIQADHGDIAHVYNRGNDFYNWFLGETMTYTSGLFESQDDSLEDAQRRKLEMVCKTVQMKEGDRHLDLGCGWGPLVCHAAKHHGTNSLGVTLAQEQADWANERAKNDGVSDRVEVLVDDYRNVPFEKFDKITCLEMAEHVGIKNFQKFLLQVRGMLKDDGIFYLQIAGLRRAWQFEDLVWGLFMGKYIFPGADASCPLGFVTGQAERAGFEVHRVENCGVHYSLTIKRWYDNWKGNKEAIIAKYGERWFRMWMIFLSWSTIIAAQGSSTVFMITLTKNTPTDKSSVAIEEAKTVPFSRMDRWVGPDKVTTQQ